MDPALRLTPEIEKARYDQHENKPDDPNYRAFLNQLFEPLQKKLKPNSLGLDFGSGPGPTLHLMFEEKGHRMNIYDPFYANDKTVFQHLYDFITTTETAEHLFNPKEEFEQLWTCLKPGGWLGIMTEFAPPVENFPDWHYRRDDTHVAFYSKNTFNWLARTWNTAVEFHGNRVAIFHKPI